MWAMSSHSTAEILRGLGRSTGPAGRRGDGAGPVGQEGQATWPPAPPCTRCCRACGCLQHAPHDRRYEVFEHSYDADVIGAGGAGLCTAAGSVGHGLKTTCITKVFPTRAQTMPAQGALTGLLRT